MNVAGEVGREHPGGFDGLVGPAQVLAVLHAILQGRLLVGLRQGTTKCGIETMKLSVSRLLGTGQATV